MKKQDNRPDQAAELRRRAEEIAREKSAQSPEDLEALPPEEIRRRLYELLVHQIELDRQNEELRRAQAELDASRARYFDLYDLAPMGYITVSEQGLILETNLTAAVLFGVGRGDLVKRPLTRFILPEDEDIHYRHRQQFLETGAPQMYEMRLLRKDGAPFWARVQTTAAQDADGATVCRTVVSDITERKRAEEEKEKAKLEAQNWQLQKAESLDRMAGAIAHHFNNQLHVVMGNLELAMLDLPQDTGPGKDLADAMMAAHKAAEVSSLMLTYLGGMHARQEPLDLSETCRRGLPLLRAVIPKDMVLETDWLSPGPVVSTSANQVQQVLTNLVTNAWEAIGDGRGVIRLAVKTVYPADIPAADRFPFDWRPLDDAYACLEVRDTGGGIAHKDMEKLFDPFFSSKFTGRGLGLPVVLGVVRAHHGVVTVESEPGRGSVFRVYFPLSAQEIPRRPAQAAKAPELEGGGTVLVVDDEQAVRQLAATMLRHLGFAVLEASDGAEAVEVFGRHKDEIRCVLCDLTMPRMDGWATLAALRQLAPDLPAILASGYDETHVMAGDHPEWPQAFLSKPYQREALTDALRRALKKGSGAFS